MKNTNLRILIAVLAAIFLAGEASSAAESITTKDYWVLRDGYSEAFTRDATVTVSHESCGHCVDDVEGFFINYPGPSGQALKYDEDGNLIYYWAEYGPDWVYVPDDPQQFLPNVMEIGQSYTREWLRNEYANGVFRGYGSDSFSFTVSGPHTTTVGAGTFTTYILYIFDSWNTSYGESGTSTRIYYLAKGVGWVKMTIDGETYELLGYSDGPPATPNLTLTTSETTVSVSWSAQVNAAGYALFYDRYPWDDTLTQNIDMGSQTSASFNLWEGATFRLAVQAYNSFGNSDQSNMAYLVIGYSLSVVPSTLSFSIGKTGSCTISGGTRPHSTTSSNTSVATVSLSGNALSVTGVSAGSATITVSDGDSGSVTVSITVVPLLSVNPTSLSLSAGATGTCAISGGIRPYTAASSDETVATVSVGDGVLLIKGASAGSATITVSDGDSSSVAVPITVVPSLGVSKTSLSLSIGGATGTCTISGGATPYSAVSSDKAVATASVNDDTLSVKGVSAGSATITVSDGNSGKVTVSITVAPLLRVNPTRLSLFVGATSACAVSGGVSPYSAASSKTSVATASVSGSLLSVKGVSAGSATITVSDGDSGKVTVSITVAPSLSVNPTSLSLSVGATDTCAIKGGVSPYSASSGDTSVAIVSVSGNSLSVKGVSAGSATVTVRESGSDSKTVSVTVVDP